MFTLLKNFNTIKPMLIISFDALSDSEYDRLLQYPAFAAFSRQTAVFREVSTVFLSNTYPVHTSVATGVKPGVHGISSNTEPFPSARPLWNCDESLIKAKTIWQAAAEKGIEATAVMWPVTARSKTIRYNIPEVLARPGKSQLWTSLRAGNFMLQFKLFLRHHKLLDGVKQPNLDYFAASCMADILREKKPGLALVHLTAYDAFCHKYGRDDRLLEMAFQALDKNLSMLLEAAGGGDVILFSDHSQLDVQKVIDPNEILVEEGLLTRSEAGYAPGESGCFVECCGGSAFFHQGSLDAVQIEGIKAKIGRDNGFRRYLTAEEMAESGIQGAIFGFSARKGYCYEAFSEKKAANHGYTLDMPDYKVFYMVKGCGLEAGGQAKGGCLLDIAPLVAKRLGLQLNF
jgi:predicted AlkP superfamily pyrophosphatase or phosphodiesterase